MKRHRTAMVLGLGLSFAMTPVAAAQTTPDPSRSQQFPGSGTADPIANEGTIEDDAIDALKEMSNYLMSAKTLGIVSHATRDVVTNDGQRIQLSGTATYKVKRPGFVIDYVSDIKSRRFLYDGKNFTIYSPKLGFYATAPAPGTNKEVLDTIYSKFGIALPLEDLFRWGSDGANAARLQALRSAYKVGAETLNGVPTDHFAFREDDVDWEVWIKDGDQPLPLKLVIVDRNDPAKPAFSTTLDWQINPTFSDSDFTFVPDANAKRIQLATFKGE